ncbi:hypothetical protein MLD38_002965 [Melastoma candidum]|uniref:Uncharacterized protein n=1 Tax=Melastoma candidum TaxID=119954 RepID=A0ACB9S0P7_9MYRT|nr:hypothetical protein MLD38_002965 [Melastoma candidum]
MEAATVAAAAASRAGSLQILPASAARKEWRAVSESQPSRSARNEDVERQKVGQVDERTIYEVQQGRQPSVTNSCSINIDTSSEDEVSRHLEDLARKREDLQLLEIQLRAEMIVKSEISEIKRDFDSQIKEHEDAAVKLQEQLQEKERALQDLERKMVEKDKEIIAMKRDNETAWAKDDLLREQKKELASYRRERDHSEAERLQHIQQIRELQEHAQDKERQHGELQEQYRVAQETILYKDEQLREAQAWIARKQEMVALQSHSLQAELRERTEQCNQLWLVWQRQFAEMEGFHMHRIQQLQLELADLKERNGSLSDGSHPYQSDVKDVSQLGLSKGNQLDANGSGLETVFQNGNSGKTLPQNERVPGASHGSPTLLGLPAYIPPGAVNALHPFIMHQQGLPHPVNSNVPPEAEHHSSVPSVSIMQQWHNQQGVPGENEVSEQEGKAIYSQNNRDEVISESKYQFHKSINRDAFQGGCLDSHASQGTDHKSSVSSSRKIQGSESVNGRHSDNFASQLEEFTAGSIESVVDEPGGQTRVGTVAKSPDSSLLDERSLLACVVRTIPSGGRIRISSTLPNRLAKMLAPLHWHDYKKKYGRLDEFVASHPKFFLIEGDYIQLVEGAQEMIAAKAAVAKVAAAAAASTTYSSALPNVAVTPMAQAHRVRNAPSLGGKQFQAIENGLVSADDPLHVPGKRNYQNGVKLNVSSWCNQWNTWLQSYSKTSGQDKWAYLSWAEIGVTGCGLNVDATDAN